MDGARSPMSFPHLVGRDDELGLIGTFVREAAQHGGALLLSGDAGVGKSVLLDATASRAMAAGTCVLRADGAQFETGVSFSFLSQLLLPVLGAIGETSDQGAMARLNAVHATALRRALGWSDGPAAGPLVLSNAAVALIREAAADRPVLMVLDDLHWADPASAAVLGFVARRLSGLRAGFIGAILPGDDGFFDRAGLPIFEIGPLDRAASERLLTSRFPALAPRVRRRLLAEAQGNPLALLELPLPLSEEQRQARSALPTVLPLTRRLLSLFAARVANLPEPTRSLLLLAALDGTGDLGVLEAAAQRSTDELAPAERARLVRFDQPSGRLVFRHPLVRSAVVEQSTIDERRRAHRMLAGRADLADLAELAELAEQMRAGRLPGSAGHMTAPVIPVFEPGARVNSDRVGLGAERSFWGRRDGWSDEPVTSIAYAAIGITRVWQGQIEEAEAWLDLAERALQAEVQPVAGIPLPDGTLLPFLLHYAAGLLQRQHHSRATHATLISQILNLPDVEARPASSPGRPEHPDDLLTDSEIRVLRYLPTRLTAQEIARQLSLSVHTVTTHTRHIYAKLGVHRRHEAVERARARGLLAPIPGLTSVHTM